MKKTAILLILFFSLWYLPANLFAQQYDNREIVNIHGFISYGYLQSDRNNFLADTEEGTFEFNELAINFSSELNSQLHIGVQFFARDLGDFGNDEVLLDWAYADYRWQDWLGMRAGKMRLSVGLYNETRDVDILRTSIFLPQSVYNEGWRDIFSSLE